ncbi:MAG: hypothetical protein C0391_02045 [Anaerolinea sp.]|nr:hypothetical protein [Anaerolinea sp.]
MQGKPVTNMKKGWSQAYKIVPWRGQLQWLGIMTVALVAVSLVAWVYLSVSSKASIAGRELQFYQNKKSNAIESIAQLETDLALVTSSTEMSLRAKKLGFKQVGPSRFTYMVIPGYGGKPAAELAPYTLTRTQNEVITPGFTQSIWDWMYGSFVQPASEY